MKNRKKLNSLRHTVEKIDRKILQLFSRRFLTTQKIQNLKREFGLPIYQKTREQKLFKKYALLEATLGLPRHFTKKLFRYIFSYSKKNDTMV